MTLYHFLKYKLHDKFTIKIKKEKKNEGKNYQGGKVNITSFIKVHYYILWFLFVYICSYTIS